MNTRWSPEVLAEYQAKMGRKLWPEKDKAEIADLGPESILQGKITKWAKDEGYPCLSFRQSKKAKGFLVPGWPDVTLILKDRVVFLELKAKTGYLKKEQKDMALQFYFLGHEIFRVKSFKRFLEIVT